MKLRMRQIITVLLIAAVTTGFIPYMNLQVHAADLEIEKPEGTGLEEELSIVEDADAEEAEISSAGEESIGEILQEDGMLDIAPGDDEWPDMPPGDDGWPDMPPDDLNRPVKADPDAPVFLEQPASVHYVLAGSGFEAPVYHVTASLPEGSAAESITLQWYVEGAEFGETITFEGNVAASDITVNDFTGKDCGVYPVYCKASCTLEGEVHETSSYTTNFIICSGVCENSVLTFSDVHEKWDAVGQAVADTIRDENGRIPALVIATGDYNNGHIAGYHDEFIQKCIDEIIDRIALQLGGIDTVWVSGNHDNGYAAAFTNANRQADLGLDETNYYDVEGGISGTGIIYDSCNLIVIGVNYEDLGSLGAYEGSENGRPTDSSKLDYGNADGPANTVYAHLDTALAKVVENYRGEIVIISTHAGLHALGIDSASAASAVREDNGGEYSITNSAAVVSLVNHYAAQYNMNIVWLFGHDHSRGEKEFFKLPGDTITATVDSTAKTYEDITLQFSYAHAGYITSAINGHQVYSLLKYDDQSIVRLAKTADGSQTPVAQLTDRNGELLFPNGLDFSQTRKMPEIPDPLVSIDGAKVKLSATNFTYNGKVQKPVIKTIAGKTLVKGKDYTIKWSNSSSKKAGTYTIHITGKGNYTGTTKATYKIVKASNSLKVMGKTVEVKCSSLKKKARTLSVTKVIAFTKKGKGTLTFTKISGNRKISINNKTGKVTLKKGLGEGTYKVKVRIRAGGTGNYRAKEKTVTFKVTVT